MSPHERPHSPFQPPNIYIIGAQSTGKTTLVNALDRYFQRRVVCIGRPIRSPRILKEVARTVLRVHGYDSNDIETSPRRALELQRLIVEAQDAAEAEVSANWFISDRSKMDAAFYAECYGGPEALAFLREPFWLETVEKMNKALVVVSEVVVSWLVDDGTRLMPQSIDDWLQFHRRFCERLQAFGLDFIVLPGHIESLEARLQFVVDHWERKAEDSVVEAAVKPP